MSLCDNCKHLMIYKNGDYVDDVSCFKNHTEVLSPSKMYCNDFAEDYTTIIKSNEFLLKENKQLMKENQELRMSPRVDVNEIESLVCENEKLKSENKELKSEITTLKGGYDEYEEIIVELKAENEKLKEENKSWLKTASRMDTIHHEDREYCERIHRENKKLKQENQQYKSLLQDMGLLMSSEDVMAIRNNFADKIIKPIFAESGFDVDVDTSNGFAISLKEEKE